MQPYRDGADMICKFGIYKFFVGKSEQDFIIKNFNLYLRESIAAEIFS